MQNQLLTVSFQRVTDESLAPKTDLSQGEECRLSSDSSDKPFVFNKPVLRSCQRFNPSRPGRVVPLKAGCSQDLAAPQSRPGPEGAPQSAAGLPTCPTGFWEVWPRATIKPCASFFSAAKEALERPVLRRRPACN